MNGLKTIQKMNLTGHPAPIRCGYATAEGKYNPFRGVAVGDVVVLGVVALWLLALLLSIA